MAQLLNKQDMQKRVENMVNEKPEVFFMGRSPSKGGPNGAGATIVELDPEYPQKGHKKYVLSFTDIEDDKPTGKKTLWFRTDKVKDIVDNIFDRQEPWGQG